MNRLLLFFFLIFFSNSCVYAQLDAIMSPANNGATVLTCDGALYDSGGIGGAGYSNGEDVIITICPSTPGDAISLDFISFALDPTNTGSGGPCNGNADNLSVWDGDDMTATFMGSYNCTDLAGLLIMCTSFNPTGCLTLRFKSNSTGTGVFAASISCTTPCARPTAVLTSPTPGVVQKVCIGDSITFNGAASFPYPGFSIDQYYWDFGDGTIDTTTGPIVTHTFNTLGEHLVDLFVIDNNDCINSNLITVPVWVGTTPLFTGTSPSTFVCTGGATCITGLVTGVTYTGQPLSITGDTMYVPDDVGSCFGSEILVNAFEPGQVLSDISDLLEINTVFEHSFMGDLVISITCPDGTQVILHEQGGGGTFLGEPVDLSGPADPPGVGYFYGWSPASTSGTWEEYGITFGGTLPTGIYESVYPLDSLVGCPLNGTWTFEMCDLWGADDGWVFEWGLEFNPALYPEITEYTPVYGEGIDSSYWAPIDAASNAIVTSISPDGDNLCIATNAAGTYAYNYFATDDFGCTYDTTIYITFNLPPTLDVGPDIVACPGEVFNLDVYASSNSGSGTCTYTVDMQDTFGDGWNGFTLDIVVDGVVVDNITLAFGSSGTATFTVPNSANLVINSTSGFFDTEVFYNILAPDGTSLVTEGPGVTANPNEYTGVTTCNDFTYLWTPMGDLSSGVIEDPTLTVTSSNEYILTVDENGCIAKDTLNVLMNATGTITIIRNDTMVCASTPVSAYLLYDLPVGTIYSWASPTMSDINDPTLANPILTPTTSTTYTLTITTLSGCILTDEITINMAPVPENLGLAATNVICRGEEAPLVAVGGIDYFWFPYNTLSCNHCSNPVSNTTVTQTYTVAITDHYQCIYTLETTINVLSSAELEANPTIAEVYSGESVELHAEGTFDNVSWVPGTFLSDSTSSNPVCAATQDMVYLVTAYNSDSTCNNTDTVFVKYMGCRGLRLPTMFSPNEDGVNETLGVWTSGEETFTLLSVYNRWGEQVFSTSDINTQWDGFYKGKPQEVGAYAYRLEGTCDNKPLVINGSITLVR